MSNPFNWNNGEPSIFSREKNKRGQNVKARLVREAIIHVMAEPEITKHPPSVKKPFRVLKGDVT